MSIISKLFFLFLIVSSSCINNIFSQELINSHFYRSDGLCATSLLLGNNKLYFYQSGCENISSIKIGNWEKIDSNIILNDLGTFEDFEVVTGLQSSGTISDTIKIFVKDFNNHSLLSCIDLNIYLSGRDKPIRFTEGYYMMKNGTLDTVSNAVYYNWDHIGIVGSKLDSIKFNKMTNLFDRDIIFNCLDLNSVQIRVNLPRFIVDFNELSFLEFEHSNYKITLKDNKLYRKEKLFLDKRE